MHPCLMEREWKRKNSIARTNPTRKKPLLVTDHPAAGRRCLGLRCPSKERRKGRKERGRKAFTFNVKANIFVSESVIYRNHLQTPKVQLACPPLLSPLPSSLLLLAAPAPDPRPSKSERWRLQTASARRSTNPTGNKAKQHQKHLQQSPQSHINQNVRPRHINKPSISPINYVNSLAKNVFENVSLYTTHLKMITSEMLTTDP